MIIRKPIVFSILFISLMPIAFNVAATTMTSTFADDKDCKKNDDNNCNENKKSQRSSPKVECEVDTEIKDHNKNSIIEPIDLHCNSNSQNLIDSTIQSLPSDDDDDNGGTSPPPSITLIPDSGPPGTVINVFGSNFEPNRDFGITFDGITVTSARADMEGNFSADFQIFNPILGPHTVTAEARLADPLASATFTVTTGGSPIIIIDPTSGPAGTSVNVTGFNFKVGADLNIMFDEDIVPTKPAFVEVNDLGVFIAFITILPGIGEHTITAIDPEGSPGASEQFTVTDSVTTSTATQGMLPF